MVTLGAAMKIPLDIDAALIAGARAVARREGATLERIVEEGLRIRLAAPARKITPGSAGGEGGESGPEGGSRNAGD